MTTETKTTLSENQKAFVRAAERAGYDVDYTYSGRGMFGDTCPSIVVPRGRTFSTRARVEQDSLGLDTVVYASR